MNTLLIFLKVSPLSLMLNQRIIPYLKGSGTWAKVSDHLWLIKTTANSVRVRDDLRSILSVDIGGGATDEVIVFDITKSDWASLNLSPELVKWIKNNI